MNALEKYFGITQFDKQHISFFSIPKERYQIVALDEVFEFSVPVSEDDYYEGRKEKKSRLFLKLKNRSNGNIIEYFVNEIYDDALWEKLKQDGIVISNDLSKKDIMIRHVTIKTKVPFRKKIYDRTNR